MVFQSWVESVPISISYDHTIFSSVKCHSFFKNSSTYLREKTIEKFWKSPEILDILPPLFLTLPIWAKKRSALLKENDSINSREVAGGPLAAHMGNVKNRGAQKWDFYNDHFQT